MSSDYVEEQLKAFEIETLEIQKKCSFAYVKHSVDAEKYLSFTAEELNKMSSHECSIGKYVIYQHAMSIQKEMNKAVSIKNWAERNLEIVTGQEIVYDGTFFKYEVIRDKIIKKNSYAKKLSDIVIEQQGKIDTLSYIVQSVREMGSSLSNLSYSKRGEIVND